MELFLLLHIQFIESSKMARTPTKSIELGFTAPEFSLPDTVTQEYFEYKDLRGQKGTVVIFICNHCPFVIHVLDEIIRIGREYLQKDIGFIIISSNDIINYPDDAPEKMKDIAIQKNFPFPYLYDETQEVAKKYDAACTPDFSVFDSENICVYRGQMDDSRPGNSEPINGKDLRNVLDYLINGKAVDFEQKPSLGCNIKWKNN